MATVEGNSLSLRLTRDHVSSFLGTNLPREVLCGWGDAGALSETRRAPAELAGEAGLCKAAQAGGRH